MISQVESFLMLRSTGDTWARPEDTVTETLWKKQNNKDEENSPKTLTDKKQIIHI